jgi:endogenous inhibitor of DNA gyrase (YacG/DUF329 family)
MSAAQDAPLCVFCRRHQAEPAWRPFCSERCKLQDLARWAYGVYRVPGSSVDDDPDRAGEPDDSDTSED